MTSKDTIRAVRKILEEQVMPSLAAADWTASNVRACLMLLTYAEDCVDQERSLFVKTNQAMASLFGALLSNTDLAWVDSDMRAAIGGALTRLHDMPTDPPLGTLAATNLDCKSLLTTIIRRASEARGRDCSPADSSFRSELHTCLNVLEHNDASVTARARTMLPI